MSERLDDLLEQALATGRLPEGISDEEADELAAALARSNDLRASVAAVDAEAEASMPAARARFERFLGEQQPSARPAGVTPTARPRFAGWFGRKTRLPALAAAAAVILVAAGLLVVPALFNDVETASAQVLVPGDYVQFQAVAGRPSDGSLPVESDFGEVSVVVDDQTEVVDATGAGAATIEPGRALVVAGVVGEDLRVRARTVSVAAVAGERPVSRRPQQLMQFHAHHGQVVALSLGDEGNPRVVVETSDGKLLVVKVDGPSLESLLERYSAAVGTPVQIVRVDGAPPGVFGVAPAPGEGGSQQPPGGPMHDRPMFMSVVGIAKQREANRLTVETREGDVTVELTRRTQVRIADPSVTPAQLLAQGVTGRFVTVVVVPHHQQRDQVIADVIIVGRPADDESGP